MTDGVSACGVPGPTVGTPEPCPTAGCAAHGAVARPSGARAGERANLGARPAGTQGAGNLVRGPPGARRATCPTALPPLTWTTSTARRWRMCACQPGIKPRMTSRAQHTGIFRGVVSVRHNARHVDKGTISLHGNAPPPLSCDADAGSILYATPCLHTFALPPDLAIMTAKERNNLCHPL